MAQWILFSSSHIRIQNNLLIHSVYHSTRLSKGRYRHISRLYRLVPYVASCYMAMPSQYVTDWSDCHHPGREHLSKTTRDDQKQLKYRMIKDITRWFAIGCLHVHPCSLLEIHSSAVIAWSKITWFCIWCEVQNMHQHQNLYPQTATNISPSRTSYGVSFVRIWGWKLTAL